MNTNRNQTSFSILIVDDESINIKTLNEVLKDEYEVRFTTKSRKALEIINSSPPDIILLDIIMPELDGYELCRQIKSNPKTQHIPIIFITEKSGSEEEAYGFEIGAEDYIKKPFSPNVVKARVNNQLATRRNQPMSGPQHRLSYDILLVEDEIINLKVAEKLLKNLGYSIYAVQTGEAAFQAISTLRFQLILLDLELPDISGFKVAEDIRIKVEGTGENYIPIIALTAHTDEDYREKCIQHGFDHFIRKPINQTEIKAILDQFLQAQETEKSDSFTLIEDNYSLSEEEDMQSFFESVLKERVADLQSSFQKYKNNESSEAEMQLRRIAHSLKGSCTLYGYHEIYDIANRVELSIGDEFTQSVGYFIDSLQNILSNSKVDILVIEEDETVFMNIQGLFHDKEYQFEWARSAQEAEQRISQRNWNVIVLDLVLPDEDGRKLIRQWKQAPKTMHIPIIAISGDMNEEIKRECFLWGAEQHFTKPLPMEEIKSAVQSILLLHPFREDMPRDFLLDKQEFDDMFLSERSARHRSFLILFDLQYCHEITLRWGGHYGVRYLSQFVAWLIEEMGKTLVCLRWNNRQVLGLYQNADTSELHQRLNKLQLAAQSTLFDLPNQNKIPYTFHSSIMEIQEELMLDEMINALEHGLMNSSENETVFLDSPQLKQIFEEHRILCVEDDDIIGAFLVQRLSRVGLVVDLVADGKSALEKIYYNNYSLIVLDIKLPRMDGYSVLENIRQTASYDSLPVLVVTSLGGKADADKAMQIGANDFIQKPFSPFDLINRVTKLLSPS